MSDRDGLKNNFCMIGDQILDVAVSEEHTFEADVTDYPVEDGSSISDNIRIKPIKITMTGIVSNYGFGVFAAARTNLGDDNPADTAYRYLTSLRDKRQVFTVITSLDRYPNMVLTSLTVPRDPGGATFLKFTAVFQQIDFVKNDKSTPTTPTAKPPSNVTRSLKDADPRPVQVLQAAFSSFGWYWYDSTTLKGWRTGAAVGPKGIWLATRGTPYGVAPKKWAVNQSDSYWRGQIKLGGGASSTGQSTSVQSSVATYNPYDPFDKTNMLHNGHVYSAKDIRTVSARIVSADEFEERLLERLGIGAPPIPKAWYDPAVD